MTISKTDPFTDLDRRLMRRALQLATLGRYTTQPNPRVGCVVAQGERIVGEGWHRRAGESHAEPIALQAAGEGARGSTVYLTLEPHGYHSRTPPCTTALIRAGVRRVVCAVLDPNPQVHGDGVRQLEAAGIEVAVGLLEAEARELNLGFAKRMISGMPRVVVKIAASIDGRVALANGASRWITGEVARADVQRLRAQAGAVLTGIDTVLSDDPQLTVRDPDIDTLGRQPLRVVLDSRLRMPATARMLRESGETVVFVDTALVDAARSGAARAADVVGLERAGGSVCGVALEDGRIDLHAVLRELGRRQCNDVLVEAGPTLAGRILQLGLADELVVYLAPKLLGPDARAMLQLPSIENLRDSLQFKLCGSEILGADLKLTWRPTVLS
jgi:diaminohydroxyphosphoribosylaminopyrimidine deaminase/5-amino-6-(5-phosphoribosylamino)uracil reductase